jgi:5-methylcytosine-specific restriction endonuclease McrA
MGDARYKTMAWKALRRRVLARDGQLCRLQLPGCRGWADQVDHTIEPSRGGAFFDEHNLAACCRSCNVAKRNANVAADAREQRDGFRTSRDW